MTVNKGGKQPVPFLRRIWADIPLFAGFPCSPTNFTGGGDGLWSGVLSLLVWEAWPLALGLLICPTNRGHLRIVRYSSPKQVEAYAKVIAALERVLEIAYQFIEAKGTHFRLDDTSRPELRRVALPQMRALHDAHHKWAIFLPKQMNEDIEAFMRVFGECLCRPRSQCSTRRTWCMRRILAPSCRTPIRGW